MPFVSFLVLGFALVADSGWLRLRSDQIEIYSNAGAPSARRALLRFEQLRRVLKTEIELPVRVVLFRSESDFQPFRITGGAAGFYHHEPNLDYIALKAGGADESRVLYHEYAHLLLRKENRNRPLWLNEGLAELYSNILFTAAETRIGDPIAAHVSLLRKAKLGEIDRQDPTSKIFYAQSWALAHLRTFAPERAQSDLPRYIRENRFTGIRLPAQQIEHPNHAPIETVDPINADLMQVDLLRAIGRKDEAATRLAKLAQAHPNHPEILAATGALALAEQDDGKARRYYEAALDSGSTSGQIRYDLAMLLREEGQPETRVVSLLEDAVRCDPKLFDAVYFLGYLALQAKQYERAIAAFTRAVSINPERLPAWELLAVAYRDSGQNEKARDAIHRARTLARSPEDGARLDSAIP